MPSLLTQDSSRNCISDLCLEEDGEGHLGFGDPEVSRSLSDPMGRTKEMAMERTIFPADSTSAILYIITILIIYVIIFSVLVISNFSAGYSAKSEDLTGSRRTRTRKRAPRLKSILVTSTPTREKLTLIDTYRERLV